MPWKITLHAERPQNRKAGDMWPGTHILKHLDVFGDKLSPRYLAMPEPRRLPYVVCLPGGVDFCVDFRAWRDGVSYGDGWTLTGPLERLTLSPSVNIGGAYHGWIRDGVISDDVEGRRFDADGREL